MTLGVMIGAVGTYIGGARAGTEGAGVATCAPAAGIDMPAASAKQPAIKCRIDMISSRTSDASPASGQFKTVLPFGETAFISLYGLAAFISGGDVLLPPRARLTADQLEGKAKYLLKG